MTAEVSVKTKNESATITLAYAVVSAILLVALGTGATTSFLSGIGMQDAYSEIYTFAVIASIGLLAAFVSKAGKENVLAVGIVSSFIALTLNQEPLVRYLALGAVLFSLGLYGMVVSRNAVRVLMSIELMLNAVNINLVAFARYIDPKDVRGQVFAIFILTVAAAEAAVGIAIVLAIYRSSATVDMEKFNKLKW